MKKKVDKMKYQLDQVQGIYITKKHQMFEQNKNSDSSSFS